MKINGMQVAPVEDSTTKKAKSRVKKNAQPAKRRKTAFVLMLIALTAVAVILAGLVVFALRMRPSETVSMDASTSKVKTTDRRGKALDGKSAQSLEEASGGVLSNRVSVKDATIEDASLGYDISVVSYIPGYKTSDGSTVVLVEYLAKPTGSVYSLVDPSALKLKIDDKVISSSSDYNREMSKLNLDVFESTESSKEVDGWLAYPINGDPSGITLYYDRGTVSVDSTSDSAGIIKPEMKKEIPLSSGK